MIETDYLIIWGLLEKKKYCGSTLLPSSHQLCDKVVISEGINKWKLHGSWKQLIPQVRGLIISEENLIELLLTFFTRNECSTSFKLK